MQFAVVFLVLLCGACCRALSGCGRSSFDVLATANDVPDSHSLPWMATVSTYLDSMCSATIIGPRHVLTAAHCIRNSASSFFVGYGSAQRNEQIRVKVHPRKVHVHPKYELEDPYKKVHDLAIIELPSEIRFGRNATAVCLSQNERGGGKVVLAGWGVTTSLCRGGFGRQRPSNVLRIGTAREIGREQCRQIFMSFGIFSRPDLREKIWNAEARYKICGDSGGPLLKVVSAGQWVQTGVTSTRSCDPTGRDPRNRHGLNFYARIDCDWVYKVAKIRCADL